MAKKCAHRICKQRRLLSSRLSPDLLKNNQAYRMLDQLPGA